VSGMCTNIGDRRAQEQH